MGINIFRMLLNLNVQKQINIIWALIELVNQIIKESNIVREHSFILIFKHYWNQHQVSDCPYFIRQFSL